MRRQRSFVPARWRCVALAALVASCGEPKAAPSAERPSAPAPPTRPATAAAAQQARASDPAEFTAPDGAGFGRAAGLRTLEVVRGGARAEERLPLVVVIHGLGDRAHAEWLAGLRVPVRLVMPQAPTRYGGGFAWFEYRARSAPPDELARGITRAAEQLARAIEVLERERPTRGRPIVTGFSQGGMLSYALALAHPERIALALPVAAFLPEPLWPRARAPGVRYPPIRALHGDADSLVPVDGARKLVAHLDALGFDAELGEHRGVEHTLTEAMEVELVANVLAAIAAP